MRSVLSCIFHSNLIFVSLPDESSRMLLKRRTLFFGLTDADMRETENVNNNNNPRPLMEIWKPLNQKVIILLEWPNVLTTLTLP